MRIVLVNWAHIWDGASYGGGVNGYCQALGLALVERGHDVISVCSGVTYTPGDEPGTIGACEVRRHDDWLGIRVFEVINSPVVAPSLLQFDDPGGEASCPELEAVIRRLFVMLEPDVVHWHNVEGFSAGCVEASGRPAGAGEGDWPGARLLYSLHNYHTICPQVYLMQGHTDPCFDSAGGANCATCIERSDPEAEKLLRAERYVKKYREAHPEAQLRPTRPAPPPPVSRQLLREIKRYLRHEPLRPTPPPPPEVAPIERPGAPVQRVEDVSADRASDPASETRGQSRSITDKERHGFVPTPDDPAWKPLLNVITPEPAPAALNMYGRRRTAMVSMLNTCDRVLAVSRFVREKFVSMGVDEDRAEVLTIGSRMNAIVEANRELCFAPEPFSENPTRPIRLIFLGYNNHYKGLHVLADALELLTPAYLRRLHVTVHAQHGRSMSWRFERLSPRLAGLVYGEGYDYSDIPWFLGGKDLTVVPSVWWDNGPQTVFESLTCGVPVLGAELGGIPDSITHGVNGLLFRGNDRFDLARRLAEVVREPEMLDRMRANVRPGKSMAAHAVEIESMYQALRQTGPDSGAVIETRVSPGAARGADRTGVNA